MPLSVSPGVQRCLVSVSVSAALPRHCAHMKIEFRNVRRHKQLSRETPCFTADLYVDGELEAHVSNRGNGGGNDYAFPPGRSWRTLDAIEDRVRALGLTETFVVDGESVTVDVDLELMSFLAV